MMAGNLSNYAENKLLDHILGTTSYTKPTTYVSLYTIAPTESTSGTEVTGGSYARQTATFSAASGGASSNSGDIDFAGMPACTVVAIGIMDAISGGNLLIYGNLTNVKVLSSGDLLRIPSGDLDISID